MEPALLSDMPHPLAAQEPPLLEEEPPVASTKKVKPFRMQAKGFSITFPQCDTSKRDAAASIEHKWPDCSYVISQEQHKDGNDHLHIYLEFADKQHFRSANVFDFIGRQHGNYQTVRSRRDWIAYVTKHDPQFLSKGIDVASVLAKKAPKNEVIAKQIMEGKTLGEINKENPGYVMINKRKLEEYESWVRCENSKKSKIDWMPPSLEGLTDTNLQIATWICANVRQNRKFKVPQLFIHGPTNHGKTSLVEWLERSLSVYHIPMGEEFYDLYSDDFDLVVFDEFKGQKTLQWMNQFLQGSAMPIRKKGSQGMKYKNLPVVILSNYRLSECYPKAANDGRLSTLEARLEIIEVDSFIDFYKNHEDLA